MTTDWPTRFTPPSRMFLSRRSARASAASESSFLFSAPAMSTCSRKCTPPRRSRPRYIGSACSAVQPARRRALQVQRDDVDRVGRIAVQRLLQQVLHAQLRVGVLQAHADVRVGRRVVERHFVRRHLIRSERALDLVERGRIELDRRLAARHLHRRRFAEEIGQRVHEADDERHQHHDIFPEGVTIHGDGRTGKLAWRERGASGDERCRAVEPWLDGEGS